MGKTYSANSADYKLLEEVGYGASATVYRAIYLPSNEVVAVKCLDLDRCNSNLVCSISSFLLFCCDFVSLIDFRMSCGFNFSLLWVRWVLILLECGLMLLGDFWDPFFFAVKLFKWKWIVFRRQIFEKLLVVRECWMFVLFGFLSILEFALICYVSLKIICLFLVNFLLVRFCWFEWCFRVNFCACNGLCLIWMFNERFANY